MLRISIEEIRTNENVVHRSGYDGRIVLWASWLEAETFCGRTVRTVPRRITVIQVVLTTIKKLLIMPSIVLCSAF